MFKAVFVEFQSTVADSIANEVGGEAVGVIEAERFVAGIDAAGNFVGLAEIGFELRQPSFESASESEFFAANGFNHAGGVFLQIRIRVAHQIDDGSHHLEEERLCSSHNAAVIN